MNKIKKEIWLRIYTNGLVQAYENEEAAKRYKNRRKLFAVVMAIVECSEGDGLGEGEE